MPKIMNVSRSIKDIEGELSTDALMGLHAMGILNYHHSKDNQPVDGEQPRHTLREIALKDVVLSKYPSSLVFSYIVSSGSYAKDMLHNWLLHHKIPEEDIDFFNETTLNQFRAEFSRTK